MCNQAGGGGGEGGVADLSKLNSQHVSLAVGA